MKQKKHIIGCYNKTVILTYIGAAASLLGIFMVKNEDIAMICLIVAGICDLFDGRIARRCERTEQEKQFGVMIDSLADVVSFLIFPCVILFEFGGQTLFSYVIGVLYMLAGIIRLGWFHITTEEKIEYYQGLPVTYSALVIAIVYAVCQFFPPFCFSWLICGIYPVMAFLFLWNVRIKKPVGIWYGVFSLLAVLTVIVIFLF